jgi:hypothetical protein
MKLMKLTRLRNGERKTICINPAVVFGIYGCSDSDCTIIESHTTSGYCVAEPIEEVMRIWEDAINETACTPKGEKSE